MTKTIVCPRCRNYGAEGVSGLTGPAAFEVRGMAGDPPRPLRRCNRCGAGLYIKAFGRPKVFPQDVWDRMEANWFRHFGSDEPPARGPSRTVPLENQIASSILKTALEDIVVLMEEEAIPELGKERGALTPHGIILLMELSMFLLHLADRIVFRTVGPAQRDDFMERVEQQVLDGIAVAMSQQEPEPELRVWFAGAYDQRVQFYATLDPPREDQPATSGLFWEAAKTIADAHFRNSPLVATRLLMLLYRAPRALKELADALRRIGASPA